MFLLSQNQVFSALAIAYVNGLLPFSNITYVNKKRKHDKESRVATILEGRKDRGKFKFGKIKQRKEEE